MNKVFLIGNLTRDPEMRTTSNGISLCSFGLAVNRRRKVESQPEVDFFNVTAWRQLGDNCGRFLRKGSKVCVMGAVQIRVYDAQDGTKRTAVDIDASDIEFLPSASQRGEPDSARQEGYPQADDDDMPF